MSYIPGLRIKRIEQGWSINELSKKVGVCSRTIRRWESGDTEPSLMKLKKLSQLLDCPYSDLLL